MTRRIAYFSRASSPRSTRTGGSRSGRVLPARRGLDCPGHDPAMLADLAVAGEPELLVGRQSAVEEKAGRNRGGVLRVALDRSPTQAGDQIKRTRERRTGDTLAAVALADIAARS